MDKNTVNLQSGFRFAVVGTVMAGLYFVVFLVLHTVIGFQPLVASVFSYTPLLFITYYLHKVWSFQSGHSVRRSLPRYLVLQFCCMAMTSVSTQVAYMLFDMDGLEVSIATTLLAGLISFFVSSLWVFSEE